MRSYEAKIAALYAASERLLEYMPSGWEPHGQDMSTTMRMDAVRRFRKACADLGIVQRGEHSDGPGAVVTGRKLNG